MARRRGLNADPVAQALGNARDRAAYALEASPMLRYTLEFFLANAIAAWGGSEGRYDRLQDSRIAAVAERLNSMQRGASSLQDAGPREANTDIIRYTATHAAAPGPRGNAPTDDRISRSRHGHERPAHAAKMVKEWERSREEYPSPAEGVTSADAEAERK